MGNSINNKTAIVTGASKGVGYATVKLLSENGYKVIAVSRNLSKLKDLVSNNVETYQLDITNENEVFKISGVIKDTPYNSHFHAKIIFSFATYGWAKCNE